MKRRSFFRNGSLALAGASIFSGHEVVANNFANKKAKNIIFLISDGMSTGTLHMANLHSERTFGKSSNWINLYKERRAVRALMDTQSANSIVTDSAAASSSFGGGARVNNGSLNISPEGKENMPIWQKFKKKGKKAGVVTSVTVTHATPAGFCVNVKNRGSEQEIADQYLEIGLDVIMGGGTEHFSAETRKDKKDMFAAFKAKGYQIAKTRQEMQNTNDNQPIIGIFTQGGIPYAIDRENDAELKKNTPSLAEMSKKAIDILSKNKDGFVLQIEGGKVDWAAHANDVAGLLYDQLAFDEAVKVAIDFAEKDKNTLVIITTDHANANPGTISGSKANEGFDGIRNYKKTNEWLLNQITKDTSVSQIKDLIAATNGIPVTDEDVKSIKTYYDDIVKGEDGLYNYRKVPFKLYSEIQKKYNSIGWISMSHSSDHVEVAAFGPGSELLKPYCLNTDLHYLMLEAAEVENKF
jgi:alkaline phosphatase